MRVTLAIQKGPMAGQDKVFDEADIFIVGRMEDCHYSLSDDPYLSRHHFMLEINPPDVCIRDLGSMNGTFINKKRFGGRNADQSPQQAGPQGDEMALKDGDVITCGYTEMKVVISADARCTHCAAPIPPQPADNGKSTRLCPDCSKAVEKEKMAAAEEPVAVAGPANRVKKAMPSPPAAAKPVMPAPSPVVPAAKPAAVRPNPLPKAPAPQPVAPKPAAGAAAPPGAVIDALIKRLLLNAAAKEALPQIKGYKVLRKLGEGGFGAVYLGEREKDKKQVALKMMLQQKAPPKRGIAMFEREIEVNRKLRHKNIIHVEDYFLSDDLHCFALEYMDGNSLWELMLQKKKLDMDEAGPIMLQSLTGLSHAHKKKIIHRDIKPPNILLSGDPAHRVVKLSDFGLAKNFARAGMTKTTITVVGAVCGSPPYMAPEHITNYRFVKPPTDVFEMGATFYHMLTGRTVWDTTGGVNCFQAILQGRIRPMAALAPNIPKAVRQTIDQALNRDPEKRFQNGGAMLKALKKAL